MHTGWCLLLERQGEQVSSVYHTCERCAASSVPSRRKLILSTEYGHFEPPTAFASSKKAGQTLATSSSLYPDMLAAGSCCSLGLGTVRSCLSVT